MPRIKVVEVLAAGAPAGVREPVESIRDGLDSARFEVSIVEASSRRDLRRAFSELRPGVVHAHGSKAGRLAREAARAAGVAKVYHSPRGYDFLSPERPAASRALLKLLERRGAAIGETIAVSESEAAAARALAPRRPVHLVRDACRDDGASLVAHDGVVVGARGEMTPDRAPDAWVHLVQRLTDSRNGVRCVWIGGGGGEAKARTDLTNMNLLMKVSVTGPLPEIEARARMRELDVFVRWSRRENDAGGLLEAMALGLPVVASDLPAHRDAVVDGVTGFLVRNEVELLERCQSLLDDGDLRRRLGAAGRERVRTEFSRARQLSELTRLYSA